jgi:hypothetical protein
MSVDHDPVFIFLVDKVVEPQAVLLKKSGILQTRLWYPSVYSCRQPKPTTFTVAEWLVEIVQFLQDHLQL